MNDSYDDPNYTFSDPSQAPPSGPQYLPVPNSPGMYYDPSTGQVYGNPSGMGTPDPSAFYQVPGASYNATSGQLTNAGQQFTPNPSYDPKSPAGQSVNSPNAAWQSTAPTPTPTPTPGPGGGGSTLGDLISPINMPFQAPQGVNLGGPPGIPYIPPVPNLTLPNYTPPPAFSYKDFSLPSWQDVQANDPGYAFRLQQGTDTLNNSAAGQGLLRSGGTLKDLIQYGQDYATNEYQTGVSNAFNVYNTNRANALSNYNTNYQTQYVDPYTFNVQKALSEYQPKELQWQTQAAAGANQNALDWTHAFDIWNTNLDLAKWNKTWPYTVLSNQEQMGLNAASGA